MKQFLLFFIVCSTGYSWQQPATYLPPGITYVGSTPAGAYIKSILKIEPEVKCDFIRWELALQQSTNSFKVNVWYGESQPNTTGFKKGGFTSEITGKFIRKKNVGSHLGKAFIILPSPRLKSSITLLQLNDRLLYFLDSSANLLIGNGGVSYLLNQQDETNVVTQNTYYEKTFLHSAIVNKHSIL